MKGIMKEISWSFTTAIKIFSKSYSAGFFVGLLIASILKATPSQIVELVNLTGSLFASIAGMAFMVNGFSREVFDKRKLTNIPENRIHSAPGWRLRKIAKLLFSPRTFELVLEPILRDLYEEYCQALNQDNNPWEARWVLIRNYWAFWTAVTAQLPISALRRLYELWKASF